MRVAVINILTVLFVLLLANESSAQQVMPVVKIYGNLGLEYTKGTIVVCDPDSLHPDTFEMYARYRGGTTIKYKKKSFSVKLVDSNDSKLSVRLLGMRSDNSWILDAMAPDRSRMRNRVAFDIWNAMNVKPYYSEQEPKARTGIDGRFVEVYYNDNYNGIYCLNEKLDRKQLKLKKTKDGEIRGLLYKGIHWYGPTFYDQPTSYSNDSSTYQDFESSYPDVDDNGYTDWQPLTEKENFVVNSSNEEFESNYKFQFDIPVLIDLHIFVNAIGAMDNSGKNQFFYIYDVTENNMMSFAPWDMDSSFGRSWDATGYGLAYDGMLYDCNLINRINIVDSTFMDRIANRYFELRRTVLSTDSIKSRFDDYFQLFEETGAAKRELKKWGDYDGIKLNFNYEKDRIHKYIDYRMEILDEFYTLKHFPVRVSDYIIYDFIGRRNPYIEPGQFYIVNGKKVFIRK